MSLVVMRSILGGQVTQKPHSGWKRLNKEQVPHLTTVSPTLLLVFSSDNVERYVCAGTCMCACVWCATRVGVRACV